ncbi:Hsp20/alpha crystallin family protein [Candidatus Gracilibacteria bacterium]|nr:Hsp20/alpha crystallin family protein [Candidatus Gracilibacteria bacterium]
MKDIIPRHRQSSQSLSPFEGAWDNFLGDFWSFPTIFDSHLWDRQSSFLPSMDIAENEKEFQVTADLPGFSPENISVEIEDDGIVVSGKHENEQEEKEKNFLRRERSFSSFCRKVNFPSHADLENVKCKSKDGVLTITVPKRPEAKKKSLKIEVEK